MSKPNTRRETQRQAWMRDRAIFKFFELENGRRPFDEILQRIRRRWPVSCAADDFADRLQRFYEREQNDRAEYWRLQARKGHRRGLASTSRGNKTKGRNDESCR